MKVLQINSIYKNKSTGRIADWLSSIQSQAGITPYIAAGEGKADSENVYIMGSPLYRKINILFTRLFGKHGFYNRSSTKKLLKWIDGIKPDIIHLHNIHGHYINVELLFKYIKKNNIPVVWTLHDCWSFTGHCAHFDYVGCQRWKDGCGKCVMKKSYPTSWFFDRSKENFRDKKALFTSVEKMEVITPSDWLRDLCRQSFLGKYPVNTIHNGVDTTLFKNTPSDIKKKLGLEDKFVILGVVKSFSDFKGGEYFLKLSEMLKEDEVILLLGMENQSQKAPDNIILLPCIDSIPQVAKIYSVADVFVNPTLQETFSLANLEAISCSTPVVTFNTGGSFEALSKDCAFVVERGDAKGLYDAICSIRERKTMSSSCREQALKFDFRNRFSEYIDVYNRLLK